MVTLPKPTSEADNDTCEEPLITVFAFNLSSTFVSKFVMLLAFTCEEPEITPSVSNFDLTLAFVKYKLLPSERFDVLNPPSDTCEEPLITPSAFNLVFTLASV